MLVDILSFANMNLNDLALIASGIAFNFSSYSENKGLFRGGMFGKLVLKTWL